MLTWTAAPRVSPLDVLPRVKPFSGSNVLFLLGTPLNAAQVAQHDIALLADKAHKIVKF